MHQIFFSVKRVHLRIVEVGKVEGTGASQGVTVDMSHNWFGIAWGRQL